MCIKIKTLLIILSLAMLSTGVSMTFYSCNPCRDRAVTFRTDSIQGKPFQIVGLDTININHKKYLIEDYSGKPIRYDSLAIIIRSSVTAISNHLNQSPSLISGAYACSPAENYDMVHKLQVTSNVAYNKAFPAGADLNEILTLSHGPSVNANSANSLYASGLGHAEHFYKFIAAPAQDRLHTLTFTYELSDRRKLQTTVHNIYITK